MKKSSIILIIMIAAAIAFFVIGILVLLYRSGQTDSKNDSQSGQSSDTTQDSNLKTYNNTRFGFQFAYPPDFTEPTNVNLTATPATAGSDYITLASTEHGSMLINAKPLAMDEITASLNDLVSRHTANLSQKTSISLGNESAVRASFTQGTISLGGIQLNVKDEDVIFVRHQNTLMWIELRPKAGDSSDTFTKVLDSFMFVTPTGSNQTSDPGSGTSNNQEPVPPPPAPPTVQSFTITADDSGATPSEITVPPGTIVDLTFNVSTNNVYYGGLDFRSSKINTGTIMAGGTKTIAFTATSSFTFTPYWPSSNVSKNYSIKVIVE